MALRSGSRLGPYEIVTPLGSGGMGEVFRARDTRLGRDIALKVLPAEVASDPRRLARLEREARTVAALNHPNIVTLHSFEESGGVRFLTMELVEGATLNRAVPADSTPLARVLEVASALAEALAAAHDRGVIHRDLKPANVMVTREGRVKVLDFGLARLTQSDSDADATQAATMAAPVSSPGQTAGTVPYMAPEQLRGEALDARTDLFAFGIVLFELITGRRPFAGATPADVASAILRDPPPRLQSLRADVPRDLDRIVSRCLEKNPRDRFQTARDVHNELRYLLREGGQAGGTPMPATAPAPVPPAQGQGASTTSAPSSSSAFETMTPSSETRRAAPSIAVLPFVNRSRDDEDEYFADGLADELLSVLGKIRGLHVAARTSAFQFKGTQEDIAVIGGKLNVATLLEGSVRRSGNRVRISVQLVKVADGYHLWSESYDRTLDDIFAVQDDIAQSVVKELRAALLDQAPDSKASGEVRAEVAEAAKGRGVNPEAHRLFLQGRYFVNRYTEQDMARAIELLRQAVALEPEHALAWALLSWAQTISAISTSVEDLGGRIKVAREAAARALAIEPGLVEGHLAMGWILFWYDFDWPAAGEAFRRARELAPGHIDVLRATAFLAQFNGRSDEALSILRHAIELDPLSVVDYAMVGRVSASSGRLGDAEAAFRKALEISPHATSLHSLLAFVLLAQGRVAEAEVEAAQEAVEWSRMWSQAVVHHAAGREEESKRALDRLIEIGADSAAFQIATVHAHRGEADEAFAWLDRAYDQRDSGLAFIRTIPMVESLKADPRWPALMKKLRFPD